MKTKYVLKENKIIMIKEENEELKAQSVAKSAMFKLKPEFEKLFKTLKDLDLIQSYKIIIEPYNRGYMMKFNRGRYGEKYKELFTSDNKELLKEIYGIFSTTSIYMQPDSFFQDYFDENNGYAKISGNFYKVKELMGTLWSKQIKRKEDINGAEKEFVKINLENIKKARDILKKLSK